ncbi:unnamed protein product [Tilletia laevis]|uniref:Feruloyl esterase n=2 Tax=Tilletia TaxID=13289 RepID=A0A177UI23_9BASI|nr:hypothetical protein CF336_g3533 [Tilletia laevis]KAE8202617.1 hypothetical protein CF328_g2110 [Tilletia controversa]KAE8261947.1 hypothetical protein A4X03_0g2839 [Tilletia caries]KAE8204551.1 hypothetical protein CF335_g2615 [Tilletia laevis]CAD6888776.1 unnamed protein product [Tilletia caries]
MVRFSSTASLLLLAAAAAIFPTSTLALTKPVFATNAADVQQPKTDGVRSWRTYASSDSSSQLWNISTVMPSKTMKTSTGLGMYAYNVIWRGEAWNPSRPLMVSFGSSISRCRDITDLACVLSKGVQDGWPWQIRTNGSYAKAILEDAGMAIVVIVSPVCYNTTRLTPIGASCGTSKNNHALRHYRPDVVIDVLSEVQKSFGFDTNSVVASGGSMGGRGALRLGTAYPLRAISVVGAMLEVSANTAMKSLPWNSGNAGEGCYSLNFANVGGTGCKTKMPETMLMANKFVSTAVQFYASPGDSTANLTTMVQPTCNAINEAGGNCKLNVISNLPGTNRAPIHNELAKWSWAPEDFNFLVAGYGGKPVAFAGPVSSASSTSATATATSSDSSSSTSVDSATTTTTAAPTTSPTIDNGPGTGTNEDLLDR